MAFKRLKQKIKKKSALQTHLEEIGKATNGTPVTIRVSQPLKDEIIALEKLGKIIQEIGMNELKKMYELKKGANTNGVGTKGL